MNQQNQTTPTDAPTALDTIQKQASLSYEDKEAIKKTILKVAENSHPNHLKNVTEEIIACFEIISLR